MNLQVATPADIDGIPREVATEYLASPKAKLTNRFRKTCATARQTVYQSNIPLRRRTLAELSPDRATLRRLKIPVPLVFDANIQPAASEVRLARKFGSLPLATLGRIYCRAVTRRRTIQRLYQKLLPDNSKQVMQLRVMLASRAAIFDMLSEAAHDAIRARAAVCATKEKAA